MKKYLLKVKSFFIAHKVWSIVFLIFILGISMFIYKKAHSVAGDTRYLTTKVTRGTIISSISSSGQVSSVSQIDLKPKVSGNVIYVGATDGKKVGTGSLIAEIDPSDAQKSVRDAEAALQSAKLSLEKTKLQNSTENMNADLAKAYEDGFSTVSDVFLDTPSIITSLNDILGPKDLDDEAARSAGKIAQDYRSKAVTAYYTAKASFEKSRDSYRLLNSSSSPSETEKIINDTYTSTQILSDAIKTNINYADYMAEASDNPSGFSSTQSTLSGFTSTINSDLSSLLSSKTSIKNLKDSFPTASIDLQSSELSVTERENALRDAKEKLADYFVRAPFAGTITNMTIKKSDSISGSTVVATLITDKQVAEISMNEVDVAKIKIGEKATLTFDAVPDLTISGSVAEIDSIGTVSQGVVTYNVKISFDTQDERVKSNMSVNAAIITDVKQDVLTVPNSAVKSQNGTSYVEMFDAPLLPPTDGVIGSISKVEPTKFPVEVGISNDTDTEIVSGLNEGEEIVSRTILPSAIKTAAAPSIFGAPATGTRTGAGTGAAGRNFGR